MNVDENGWATGLVKPFAPGEAWSLLSPDASSRVVAPSWAHQASTFFRANLSVVGEKRYPSGAEPLVDVIEVDIARRGEEKATRVVVVTTPLDRAPDVRESAERGVRAIGGAGFDVLLSRARRLWQARAIVPEDGDKAAPLAVAAVLALVFLAPIVPPNEETIFGVKGARERLEKLGWRT